MRKEIDGEPVPAELDGLDELAKSIRDAGGEFEVIDNRKDTGEPN